MPLRKIDKNIWVAEKPMQFMQMPFGTRMTVVKLKNGHLWLHSPVKLDDELKAQLAEIGKVKYLVSPNLYHHLFLTDYLDIDAGIEIYAAKGLSKKRKDLKRINVIDSKAKLPWAAEIKTLNSEGMPFVQEIVFLHGESKTLVVTDMLQNFQKIEGFLFSNYLKLSGIYKKPGVSMAIRYSVFSHKKFRIFFDQVLEWEFQKIIMSHGELIEENAKQILLDCYKWLGR